MNQQEAILVRLLSSAIRNQEYCPDIENENIDWRQIYNEALAHQVHTLIYPLVSRIYKTCGMEKNLFASWQSAVFFLSVELTRNFHRMGEVFRLLHNEGISVIALKGMVLNELYPYPELRFMSDIDILVRADDMEAAAVVLSNVGYSGEKEQGAKHIRFQMQGFMQIELHRQLIEYERIKNREHFEQAVWKNTRQVTIYNDPVLAMSWEMQFLHSCLHLASHIIYGGFGLRQLCDLVLITEMKGHEIDWQAVAGMSAQLGVFKFICALLEVCNRLFGMKIPCEFINEQGSNSYYIDRFIEDIFSGGSFGMKNRERFLANILLKNSSNKYPYENNLSQKVELLFPSYSQLSARSKYSYIKKYPVLLPVAWLHRLANGVTRRDIAWTFKKSIFEDKKLAHMAKERDSLLRWFELR